MPARSPSLDAAVLRRVLVAGAHGLLASREELDRINVFPVADGDTGGNLAAMAQAMLDGALARRARHAGELMDALAMDAVDGARGNSGAILAQFVVGMAAQAAPHRRIDGPVLARMAREGAAAARGALARPVEGTILSVLQAWAQALTEGVDADPRADLRTLLGRALQVARAALARTPEQLGALRRAGVVDAGARGFVAWLEGIDGFVREGARGVAIGAAAAGPAPMVHASGEGDPRHRYCCECVVQAEAIDMSALREALDALDGDSRALAGTAGHVRVHLHSARPQEVFDACARFGRVGALKADDMRVQALSARDRAPVAVLTDSASDLPPELVERHGIGVVPVRVRLDGRDYMDRVALDAAQLYRRMAASAGLPATSQPPPGDFRRMFEHALAHRPSALYVGLARALSGTLQAAESAATRWPATRLAVFDSGTASCGQSLLVWRAAELAAGESELPAILEELARLRPLTRTWAMSRDVDHAVRGGRLPRWAARIVQAIGLVPVARFTAGGRVRLCGGLFARERAPEAFARYVARRLPAGGRWRLVVGHADAGQAGERLRAALRSMLAIEQDALTEIGAGVGAHAGPGTLLVALQPAPG